ERRLLIDFSVLLSEWLGIEIPNLRDALLCISLTCPYISTTGRQAATEGVFCYQTIKRKPCQNH
ncbi:hypothetical protein, partial [Photobacterium damselae]|uniref:hypothetical protein n=1 Tax=Photobacterium damselae TaxID=38293 RepID=UPI001ADE6119